ncbi:MAG: hypothetical protein ACE5HU_00310 [Acidobacteriota bacterium]
MRTRRLGLAACAVLLLGPGVVSWVFAGLPKWAEPIAKAAPPLPEGVAPYPSRVLLSEVRYQVLPDGSLRIRRRLASQALSTESDEIGTGAFALPHRRKIKTTKAWHVPPGKRTGRKSHATPIDFSSGDVFLTDSKVRSKRIPGIKKGSLVFFEFEATEMPYFLSLTYTFFEGAPVRLARFELETPPGWQVSSVWLRQDGPDPAVNGNVRSWELRDLPAPEVEPLGPDPSQEAPMLAIHVIPPAGTSGGPAIFQDWAAFSRWYDELAKKRAEVTPQIEAAATKALAGAGEDPLEKIAATGKYVRDRVRYVAVELGIGGYRPHAASETLANLYGDCKDKETLFQSLLAVEGITTYPVLINLTEPDTVADTIPVGVFNHLVAAVRLPDGLDPPARFNPAIIDGGDLGRLLIVDTTDERTAIGSLSANLAGKRGLLVAGSHGRLITLPEDPVAHRVVRNIRSVRQADGSVSVARTSTYIGQFAAEVRASYGTSSEDRRRAVERKILQLWPGASVRDYKAEYETAEGAFVETVSLQRDTLALPGTKRVRLFPGAADDIDRVSLRKRKTGVDYGHTMTIRYEVTYDDLPFASLPSPRSVQGDGWSVETAYKQGELSLEATWEVRLHRTRFDPDQFPELRKFWSAVKSAARATATLAESPAEDHG